MHDVAKKKKKKTGEMFGARDEPKDSLGYCKKASKVIFFKTHEDCIHTHTHTHTHKIYTGMNKIFSSSAPL